MATETTGTAGIRHPQWCGQGGCEHDESGDVWHREVPRAVLAMCHDDEQPLALGLVQIDEVFSDGRQVSSEPRAAVTLGALAIHLTPDQLDTLAATAVDLAAAIRNG